MFKNYYFIALILLSGCFSVASAQGDLLNSGYDNGTNLNVLYRNDGSAKIYAATRGFGFSYRRGKHVNAKLRSYYEIDAQNLKYPKEIRVSGDAASRRRFIYGKVNSVFLIRPAIGLQHTLFGKADNKSIEVRYSYSIGPSVALAKPYYVQVDRTLAQNQGGGGSVKEGTAVFDDASFSDPTYSAINVTGRGTFLEGVSEMKFYPAISGKFNLSFEYAPYTNLIRAIETSITVDYFPKALPIMARNRAENIVIQLNVGFVFGKKWY